MRNTKPDKIHTYEPIVRRKERKAPIPMNSGLPKKFQHFEFPIGDSVEKQKKVMTYRPHSGETSQMTKMGVQVKYEKQQKKNI